MSMWLDWIHWIGIIGEVLALIALYTGLCLFFRIGGKGFTWQNKMRSNHMRLGIAAVILAVLHTIFRLIPKSELPFELEPPFIAMWAFIFVLISGRLRFSPPEFLQGKNTLLAWSHRSMVLLALITLMLHATHEVQTYLLK